MMNNAYSASISLRRSKRSIYVAASKLEMAAVNVYDDSNKPNWCVSICKTRVNCGPRGIMIMKSRMCVNCMPASASKNRNSFLMTGVGEAECKDGLPVGVSMDKSGLLIVA